VGDTAIGWASRAIAAHLRGSISAAELWDILLAHMDDLDGAERASRLLTHLEAVFAGAQPAPRGVLEANEMVVLDDQDQPELLAG
jgi:hypothetical protein